jgi:hypothetical protein
MLATVGLMVAAAGLLIGLVAVYSRMAQTSACDRLAGYPEGSYCESTWSWSDLAYTVRIRTPDGRGITFTDP